MKILYVHKIAPIDFWEGWQDPRTLSFGDIKERVAQALEAAREDGWEGDGHPRFSMIPAGDGDPGCEVIVAVKQSNNGTTFVVAPMPLKWLGTARLVRVK